MTISAKSSTFRPFMSCHGELELPAFVDEIRRLFTAQQIHDYLDHLEHTKFFAPQEQDTEMDDLDDETEEESWLENPLMGAEELLRFSPIRQLLSSAKNQSESIRRQAASLSNRYS